MIINFIPNQPTTSLILLKPVSVEIPGFGQELTLEEGQKLIRDYEENENDELTNIDWSKIDQDQPLFDLFTRKLETLYTAEATRNEYFGEYIIPFVDVPDVSQIEKLIYGDKERYNIRLSFRTEAEANEMANHIDSIYQNKMDIFKTDNREVPTIWEVCELIACCSSKQEDPSDQADSVEVSTVNSEETEHTTLTVVDHPKTDQFDGPMTEIASHNQLMN